MGSSLGARNTLEILLGELSKDFLTRPLTRNEVCLVLLRVAVFGATTYFSIKWVSDALDPAQKQRIQLKKRAEDLMKQIGIEKVKLSEYEMNIVAHLVVPRDIKVTWNDVAGLDELVSELRDTVILPLQQTHLFEHSKLCQPPKGVLLYGPPGCGKTLLAKAMAQASSCRFINLQASTLMDKWYGESQKLTAAVFSLAIKIQPCIIFIDEIDAFLRNRSRTDHEATAMMKAEFMSLWDGLQTASDCQVVVLGATNRPQDVDPAILRRMPTTFHIALPTQRQRQDILKLILAGENRLWAAVVTALTQDSHKNQDVVAVELYKDPSFHLSPIKYFFDKAATLPTLKTSNAVSLKELAERTRGYSGSDLWELCRDAATYRVRDYIRKQQMRQVARLLHRRGSEEKTDLEENSFRPLTQLDLLLALEKMKESRGATSATLTEPALD